MKDDEMDPWDLLKSGKTQLALKRLARDYHRDPGPINATALGVAYLWLRRFPDAAMHFDSLNEKHPMYGSNYYGLAGCAKWAMGLLAEAVLDWRHAVFCAYGDASGNVGPALLVFFAAVRRPATISLDEARELVMQRLSRRCSSNWPGPLGRYVLGEFDDDRIAPHCQGVNPLDTDSRLWTLAFYRGVLALQSGRNKDFFGHLRWCASRDGHEYSEEFYLSRSETEHTASEW